MSTIKNEAVVVSALRARGQFWANYLRRVEMSAGRW